MPRVGTGNRIHTNISRQAKERLLAECARRSREGGPVYTINRLIDEICMSLPPVKDGETKTRTR